MLVDFFVVVVGVVVVVVDAVEVDEVIICIVSGEVDAVSFVSLPVEVRMPEPSKLSTTAGS